LDGTRSASRRHADEKSHDGMTIHLAGQRSQGREDLLTFLGADEVNALELRQVIHLSSTHHQDARKVDQLARLQGGSVRCVIDTRRRFTRHRDELELSWASARTPELHEHPGELEIVGAQGWVVLEQIASGLTLLHPLADVPDRDPGPLELGLIRLGGQFDYAACRSVNCLSNSAGLTIPTAE
jgi:hypothetical protein